MANFGRYFDGETAVAHDVSVRTTTNELVIFKLADTSILARWPIADLAVLGDVQHEAVPPVVRKGSDARLLIEDPDFRRELASLVPQLGGLVAPPLRVGRRIAAFGATLAALVGLFWLAIDYGTELIVPVLPYSLQVSLGESVFEELTADKDECHGEAGMAALNKLANRLAREAGYGHEVTVHMIEGGPLNAFTLPGGILVFYSDLVDQARERSQVAGRDGARDRPCRPLPSDQGPAAPVRRRAAGEAGERRIFRSAEHAHDGRQPAAGDAQRS